MSNKRPIVGTLVLLIRNDKILLSERKCGNYSGFYATPGGKVDFGESLIDTIKRETMEEAGLAIKDVKPISYIGSRVIEDRHNICLCFIGSVDESKNWDGTVDFVELDKNGEAKTGKWDWYSRKEIDYMKLMPNIKEAWDYYIYTPGLPFIHLNHSDYNNGRQNSDQMLVRN